MPSFEQLHLLFPLLMIAVLFSSSSAQQNQVSFCGKLQVKPPFLGSTSNSSGSPPLNRMILCRSENLYLRTSLGLFPISSIDYKNKTLTVSHPSYPSWRGFVSPSHLSSGLPSPPHPNNEGHHFGMKVTFDIHAPDPCKNCKTQNASCGAALECVCQPSLCKDKVISTSAPRAVPSANAVLLLLSAIVMLLWC